MPFFGTDNCPFQINIRMLFIPHLESGEKAVLQQGVNGAEGQNIRIQIDPPFIVQGIQPDIIRNKCPLASRQRIPGKRNAREIKTVPVPEFPLIVRKIFLPGIYTVLDVIRHPFSAEPAIMDNFRYHIKEVIFLLRFPPAR